MHFNHKSKRNFIFLWKYHKTINKEKIADTTINSIFTLPFLNNILLPHNNQNYYDNTII